MSDSAHPAVFLSYASQDEAVARQLCEALRAAGIVVWFDQSELRGGDAWDASIRRQIRDCALFVPLVSASTQQRREGYFRLEWSLADERSRLIAEGTPFILPVVVDATKERDALVPKSFLNVQWTWLPHGSVPPAFVVRVQKLVGVGETGASISALPAQNLSRRQVRPRVKLIRLLPWALTVLLAAALAWMSFRPSSSRSGATVAAAALPVSHTIIQLPENAPLAPARALPFGINTTSLALSPDGTLLVYVAQVGTTTQLYRRSMDNPVAQPMPDTEGAYIPFFSPDGRSIGFFARDKLKKVSVLGGAAVTLCDAGNELHGAGWGTDRMIYFAPLGRLNRVSDSNTGGAIDILGDTFAGSPMGMDLLPDAKHALGSFGMFDGLGYSGDYRPITRLSFDSKNQSRVIERGYSPRFLFPSHLVFARGSGLLAVPFDPQRAESIGDPVPVIEGVLQDSMARVAQFAVSANGTLVYAPGGVLDRTRPAWVDRNGRVQKLPMEAQTYGELKLSPDGNQLAILIPGVNDNVWIFNLETGKGTPLAEPGVNHSPVWTPDGKRLIFASTRGAKNFIYSKAVDGSGEKAELLYEAPASISFANASEISPDGTLLLIETFPTKGGTGVLALSLDGSGKVVPLMPHNRAWFIRFSPDGHWITFTSDKSGSGRSEVYVQRFPAGNQVQISYEGGEEGMWSAKGDELFYRNRDAWMVAAISFQPTYKASAPRELFRGPFYNVPGYSEDVAPDGQRFLMLMPEFPETPVTQLHVIVNWSEELKRRVPVGPMVKTK
jgi:hypothetical protein